VEVGPAFSPKKITPSSVPVDAHRGCYLVVPNDCELHAHQLVYPSWCFGEHALNNISAEAPDIAIDPVDGMLSIMNTADVPKTYFVSVSQCNKILLRDGSVANPGSSRGQPHDYITFVVLSYPRTRVDLCKLVPSAIPGKSFRSALRKVRISSDIQDYERIEPSEGSFDLSIFPLCSSQEEPKFVCTQASGGILTHFAHKSTYHAVDFRCRVGTPIVAPFDCVVTDIRSDSDNSGVRVKDLFSWNSMMIKSTEHDSIFCEFVHLRKDSMRFRVGDSVKRGAVICESGDVGFCPEPHLHMEIHSSDEPGTDSIRILYNGEPFIAGLEYS